MFSQGEKEAWELVRKARFIHSQLPDFMKLPVGRDTKGIFDILDNHSSIEALASTEKAGRSTDATVLVRDEVAYHPYAQNNFASVMPTIDAGGQAIDLSTIDKEAGLDDSGYHFTERILRAKSGATYDKTWDSGIRVIKGGESGATLIFLSWKLRPTRQEGMTLNEWFDLRIKPKYTPLKIEQEYPDSLEEALKTPETTAFFDRKALEDMLLETTDKTLPTNDINLRDGVVKIRKYPTIGRRYVIFTDPSDGIEDPTASIVMDSNTFEEIASYHGKIKADESAKIHDCLVRYYHNAFNTWDANASAGGKFSETIRNLQTPNQAPRRTPDGKIVRDKDGWAITPPLREKMLDGIEEAVRRRLITVHTKQAIEEMRIFCKIDGKAQAPKGYHDDYVMAWAGAWHLRKFMPSGDIMIKSSEYKG
jgi:hypothetical protein